MTDPNDLGSIPQDLRALVEAEKLGGEPVGEVRERVLLRLAGTFAARDRSRATRIAPRSRLQRAAAIFLAIFLMGVGAGAAGYHVVRRARERRAPALAHMTPAGCLETTRSTVPPPPPPPVPTPVSPPAASAFEARLRPLPKANAATALAEPRDDALAAERRLLEMARTALALGQADRALAALKSHARQFPHCQLEEERSGLLIQALVAARKYDQARAAAARFNQRYPRSLFRPVVEQSLRSIP